MRKQIHPNSIASNDLIQSLNLSIPSLGAFRSCPALPDLSWLNLGLRRALNHSRSGRDFLQSHNFLGSWPVARSTFFESLKSSRRLSLCRQFNHLLFSQVAKLQGDPLVGLKGLEKYDIYIGDGHFLSAAAHDRRYDNGKKYPVGHLFYQDMRSTALGHLCVSDQVHRKKEHDVRALKRLGAKTLRLNAPKGRRVIWVWDKACIDFGFWEECLGSGVYFLTRAKENLKFIKSGDLTFDAQDPINRGIVADELTGTSTYGRTLRLITYQCPVTQQCYQFLTNVTGIVPGVVAMLYRRRWDIEKVFDETKNRLGETKAWASSATAKSIQAQFICMAYNFLLWIQWHLEIKHGIVNHAENRRRQKRQNQIDQTLKNRGRKLPSWYRYLQQPTQRGVKLIRWVANQMTLPIPWNQALDQLRLHYHSL